MAELLVLRRLISQVGKHLLLTLLLGWIVIGHRSDGDDGGGLRRFGYDESLDKGIKDYIAKGWLDGKRLVRCG